MSTNYGMSFLYSPTEEARTRRVFTKDSMMEATFANGAVSHSTVFDDMHAGS
jgi:hypothetical protein